MKKVLILSFLILLSFGCKQKQSESTQSGISSLMDTARNYYNRCSLSDNNTCEIEQIIFDKTNEYRKNRGLSELQSNDAVSFIALDWSTQQAAHNQIGHGNFSDRRIVLNRMQMNSVLNAEKVTKICKENVAMYPNSGSDNKSIGEHFVNMLTTSIAHNQNILSTKCSGDTSENLKYLGIGVAKASNGSYYLTQIFAF